MLFLHTLRRRGYSTRQLAADINKWDHLLRHRLLHRHDVLAREKKQKRMKQLPSRGGSSGDVPTSDSVSRGGSSLSGGDDISVGIMVQYSFGVEHVRWARTRRCLKVFNGVLKQNVKFQPRYSVPKTYLECYTVLRGRVGQHPQRC